jgi:predicted DNA repair protein MutK
MAAGGLLALLDDIAAVLDDVAVMSKVAIKKTAGIAGDDLAVGAGTVSGADPSRELPVVWAVAKGSFINKLYLVPGALVLNAVAPFAIQPLLMAGGLFFCYEGAEKILHARKPAADKKMTAAFLESEEALLAFEKEKIKSAIRTDLVLSAEIVVITLGAVAAETFAVQVAVLSFIAVFMTVGIYGLVAGIVKLDDLGFHLSRRRSRLARRIGALLLRAAPWVMKSLSVIGTAAMILVGGELILHGIPPAAHALHDAGFFANMLMSALAGLITGFAAVPAAKYCGILWKKVISIKPHKKTNRRERP